jgi:hypothetical protein
MGITGNFLKEVAFKLTPEREVDFSKGESEAKGMLVGRSKYLGPEMRKSTSCCRKMKLGSS